jgi:hypothetical protein
MGLCISEQLNVMTGNVEEKPKKYTQVPVIDPLVDSVEVTPTQTPKVEAAQIENEEWEEWQDEQSNDKEDEDMRDTQKDIIQHAPTPSKAKKDKRD